MGSFFARLFSKKQAVQPANQDQVIDDHQEVNRENNFEEDAEDAAIFALSMKQGDDSTNYELSISCESLPKMDALSLTDPMVVLYLEER